MMQVVLKKKNFKAHDVFLFMLCSCYFLSLKPALIAQMLR